MNASFYVKIQSVMYEGDYYCGVFSTLEAAMEGILPEKWEDSTPDDGGCGDPMPVQAWSYQVGSSCANYIYKYTIPAS